MLGRHQVFEARRRTSAMIGLMNRTGIGQGVDQLAQELLIGQPCLLDEGIRRLGGKFCQMIEQSLACRQIRLTQHVSELRQLRLLRGWQSRLNGGELLICRHATPRIDGWSVARRGSRSCRCVSPCCGSIGTGARGIGSAQSPLAYQLARQVCDIGIGGLPQLLQDSLHLRIEPAHIPEFPGHAAKRQQAGSRTVHRRIATLSQVLKRGGILLTEDAAAAEEPPLDGIVGGLRILRSVGNPQSAHQLLGHLRDIRIT